MNPFEKISNYHLFSRMHDANAIVITSHERIWLRTMLSHPSAAQAFSPETLEKLQRLLEPVDTLELTSVFQEKAKSAERQVYHPLLRRFRRILERNQGMRITYSNKIGRIARNQSGFPYKLEYSMVKREWYLLWYHLRHRQFMQTKLQSILSVQEETIPAAHAADFTAQIGRLLDSRKEQATVEVVSMYNEELSRILYAFSCFEKEVEYAPDTDTYRIVLTYLADEREYILSKIRFLGKRVKVVEGNVLQDRMRESATKALSRYGL
ncbi:WYL domain-containing protein [Brevibacillus sp. TJ4]|uniref:WYL domain-containing protein n=1 Tax=Brevibacillus sp. TJ4 TaxID=3234853 RepID=UPI0037D92D43